jgi:hypothetical protein
MGHPPAWPPLNSPVAAGALTAGVLAVGPNMSHLPVCLRLDTPLLAGALDAKVLATPAFNRPVDSSSDIHWFDPLTEDPPNFL